jgi:hypothetical protein
MPKDYSARFLIFVQTVTMMLVGLITLFLVYQVNVSLHERAQEHLAQSQYFACIVVIPIDQRTPERIAPCLDILREAGLESTP